MCEIKEDMYISSSKYRLLRDHPAALLAKFSEAYALTQSDERRFDRTLKRL